MTDQPRPSTDPLHIALLRRAGFRCEYCHRGVADAGWHVDHVIPRSAGGSEELENLAVSCARCNVNKREATSASDPLTFRTAPLFNPRQDAWDTHFRRINHFLAGTTATGRATATLLFRQTDRAQHSAPLPHDVGVPLLHGPEASYLSWLYGQRKAARFELLLSELDPRSIRAEMDLLRQVMPDEVSGSTDHLLAIERAAVAAEALTSRCFFEDLVEAERLCAAAIALCLDSGLPGALRLRYFRKKRILAWRQLGVSCALKGSPHLAAGCLKLSIAMSLIDDRPATEEPFLALPSDPGWVAFPRRQWRTRAEMRHHWSQLLAAGERGRMDRLLRFLDDLAFRGSRGDADELGVLESVDRLVASSGYGMDADLHNGVLLMRRQVLLQGRFNPAAIDTSLDRHLARWTEWGCMHNLRSLTLGLAFIHASFGSRVNDVLPAAYSAADVTPLSAGLEREVISLLESTRAGLES